MKSRMHWRGLLVSVRDGAEVDAALSGGATIIDVKEPLHGSLGRANPLVIASIAGRIGKQTSWTMACGELHEDAQADRVTIAQHYNGVRSLLPPHALPPAAVKIGLAGMARCDWPRALQGVWNGLPEGVERVAVSYADWQRAQAPPPLEIIQMAAAAGCYTLLIDTFHKSAGSLLQQCPLPLLAEWIQAAQESGLQTALAGGIKLAEIPAICALGPDVVALRSAVCLNGRAGTVCKELVQQASRLCGVLPVSPIVSTLGEQP